MSHKSYADQLVDDFNRRKKAELREILLKEIMRFKLQLTPENLKLLGIIMQQKPIEDMFEHDLIRVLDLCQRTIQKTKSSSS